MQSDTRQSTNTDDTDIIVPTPNDEPRQADGEHAMRVRSVVDRRMGIKHLQPDGTPDYAGPERRAVDRSTLDPKKGTGLERRRGAGIRRDDERRSAEEGEMTPEQFEFVMAVETYKKVNRKMFPTWTEVLEVITQLGYRKVEERKIKLENVPEAPLTKKVA